MDWKFGQWAKYECISANTLTRLLSIDGVSILSIILKISLKMIQLPESLGLSYKNTRELNMKIDRNLHGCPSFHMHDIAVGDEVVTLHARNILDCIQALYGNPEFTRFLIFKPQRYYHTSAGHTRSRVYHDMHTVDWWWEVQACKPYSSYCLDITDFD